jgi:hypothetical protein
MNASFTRRHLLQVHRSLVSTRLITSFDKDMNWFALLKKQGMKRTLSQMQEICEQYQQSGLSRREFCNQHNIAHQTFNYWYKRISSKGSSGFSEVILRPSRKGSMEIIFSSGARIICEGEPSVRWLRELVS